MHYHFRLALAALPFAICDALRNGMLFARFGIQIDSCDSLSENW